MHGSRAERQRRAQRPLRRVSICGATAKKASLRASFFVGSAREYGHARLLKDFHYLKTKGKERDKDQGCTVSAWKTKKGVYRFSVENVFSMNILEKFKSFPQAYSIYVRLTNSNG